MKFSITFPDWQREVAFTAAYMQQLDAVTKVEVLNESNQAEEKIKEAMPVDTGRARTGWGHYTPGLMVYDKPSNPSTPADSVWEVGNEGLTITQGTTVPYTPGLNEGSSRQAAAGFVDAIALLALEDLETAVTNEAERLWRR